MSVAGFGSGNMFVIRRLVPSKQASQMICPMKGSTSTYPRALWIVRDSIPEGYFFVTTDHTSERRISHGADVNSALLTLMEKLMPVHPFGIA